MASGQDASRLGLERAGAGLGAGRLEADGGKGVASGQDASRPMVGLWGGLREGCLEARDGDRHDTSRPVVGRECLGDGRLEARVGDVASRPGIWGAGTRGRTPRGQDASRMGVAVGDGLGAGRFEDWGGGGGLGLVAGRLKAVDLVVTLWQDASRPGVGVGGGLASGHPSTRPGVRSKQQIKKPKYVQISVESYSHLTGLEDQVKSLEEQVNGLEGEVKDLDEKLSAVQLEMTNKENLAESEAATLKNYLESVTLLKLTAEDRASHLDGALKECMRKIHNLKEEHEQKLHDVIQNKAKQFEKMKHEFEAKIANLDQQLLRSAAVNSALSSSLQERSRMVIKLSKKIPS
ncbi:hypothetical protein MTR67_020048 [Solanum verrucosum]|uniref:Uncharacterized protein n=1 Tax=Solanum verrucosum TaxID=315347 RepID=A0AAF0TVE9_SOLVR|nr:hypothetical protein MTR67_020048 [Solanum verrucosum]